MRQAVKQGTPVGLKAKAFMDKGELVPDSVVVGIVLERLQTKDCRKGFLLDGFPRNLAQARELDEALAGWMEKIDKALYLKTDAQVVLRRLTTRRVCKNCGAVYNVRTIPPKQEGICDTCGGPVIQRVDDQEKTINNRLEVYERETADLIDYYRGRGVLLTLNGNLEREDGFREMMKALGESQAKASR